MNNSILRLKKQTFQYPGTLLLIIVIAVIACSSGKSMNIRNNSKYLMLEKAYEMKSFQMYESFFEQWHRESNPITDDELSKEPEYLKDIYSVMNLFYNSKDKLQSFTTKEIDRHISENQYVILQNRLNYFITLRKGERITGKIDNFRPDVKYRNKKYLYLNNEYEAILKNYYKIRGTDASRADRESVFNYFIKSDRPFIYPNICDINVYYNTNPEKGLAIVSYTFGFVSNWTSMFKKRDGKWILIETQPM